MPSVKYQNRDSAGGSGLIPEGKIALQVLQDEYTCDKISSNGNEMISLRMQMVGEYDVISNNWVPREGGKLFERLTFTEKSAWRIDNFLNSTGKAPAEGEEFSFTADDTHGWVAYCEVCHEASESEKFPFNAVIKSYIKVESEFHPRHAKAVNAEIAPSMQEAPKVIEDSSIPF